MTLFKIRFLTQTNRIDFFAFRSINELNDFLIRFPNLIKCHYSFHVDGRYSLDRYSYPTQEKYLQAVQKLVSDIKKAC